MNSSIKKRIIITTIALSVIIVTFLFAGCRQAAGNQASFPVVFSSYRDIPGVTESEIAAIEELRDNFDYFVYGMPLSTEAFNNQHGELSGFSSLFSEWLSELFDIRFHAELIDWGDILAGLETGDVHFSGELTPTVARIEIYDMTSPIAMRPLKSFRIADSEPIDEILANRTLLCGFIRGTATINAVSAEMTPGTFEIIELDGFSFVYDALVSGEIDVFYYSGVAEFNFIEREDMVISEFFPLIFMPVSLTTQTPELQPIISIVELAMQNDDVRRFLSDLYNEGYQEYLKYKLFVQLTEDERNFIQQSSEIPFAAENDNYPFSFYNSRDGQWQGIAIDVLHEVEAMTGLIFVQVSDRNDSFSDMLQMMAERNAAFITDLMYTEQRSSFYLWPDTPLLAARSSLISRSDHRDVALNEILHMRIGVIKGYAHTQYFRNWFPTHQGIYEYDSLLDAFDALDRGDIAAVMAGDSSLLMLTHYLERPGYKIIYLFDNQFSSTFGISRYEPVLHSIMNKALRLVNTEMISEQWARRTFDYQSKIVEAQRPWIISAFAALTFILVSITVANIRGKKRRRTIEDQSVVLNDLLVQLNKESTRFEESAHWYKSILDAIPLAISVTDRDMRWTFVNKALETFLGVRREQMMGLSCSVLNTSICNTPACGIECARNGMRRTFFDHLNSSFQVDIEVLRNMEGEISGFIEVVQDITNVLQLTKDRTEAEIANQTKTTFLANMSHEIRTPMNSIVGFAELALDDDISLKTRNYLRNILSNSEGLLQIINDILDISKIESGKMELESIPFDPRDLLSACRTIVTPRANDKGLKLDFYADPPIGKMPLGDPTRLRQIFVNLLSNAVKFTESGTVRFQATIKEMDVDTLTVYIEIKDTGIGMTAEQIKEVFTPFKQAESETTRKYGGTGLGLAITKNLLDMMGGELHIESTPGVGSRFSFELTFDTVEIPEDKTLINQGLQRTLRKPAFEGEILLCEDNSMNQQVICEHLARVGLKTVVAENGRIGVDIMRDRIEKIKSGVPGARQFDLIFMDMHMPEMDGLEATAIINKMDTGVPIVAMTANIMSSDKEQYESGGMSGYLGKPFTSQELWRCLIRYFKPLGWESEDKTQEEQAYAALRPKLISKFVENNTNKCAEIASALSSGDLKLAHRLAHTLKGNAGQLGKKELQNAAEAVENSLKDGVNHVTGLQMNDLDRELNDVIEEFSVRTGEADPLTETSDKSEKALLPDTRAALELFDELELVLKDNNFDCLTFVDDLRAIPGSGQLIRQIENFDFAPAIDTLAELRSKVKGEKA